MSTSLERLQYGFDRASRRTWRRRAMTTAEDQAFGYDGLSQVTQAARGSLNLSATAIAGVPVANETWDFDPTGNWRTWEQTAGSQVPVTQERVHDKGNRLTQVDGAPASLLDPVGRMTQVPVSPEGNFGFAQQVKWDAWSRIVRMEYPQGGQVSTYAYDGLTRRTTRTTGGTVWHSYYSDAWRPLEERRDSETSPAMHYHWGARHRDDLVRRDRATTSGGALNETRYVLMDYFSPAAIIDGTGAVKERYTFSAFGERRILNPDWMPRSTSECTMDFAFQGQFRDSESGFYNYGYRSYSPQLGRWLCKDPIEEYGGVNLYGYGGNDPVSSYDLYGLAPDGFFDPGFVGQPQPEDDAALEAEIERANAIVDDKGRKCYEVSLDTSPISSTDLGDLLKNFDRTILLNHGTPDSHLQFSDRYVRADAVKKVAERAGNSCRTLACYVDPKPGHTVPQSAMFQQALSEVRQLQKKQCCPEIQKVALRTGPR